MRLIEKMKPNKGKAHRFKGEGPMYWCELCQQRHVKHSKKGQKHWKANGGT